MSTPNLLKCRWCDWTTQRFRGKQSGHGKLRSHVLDAHLDAYLAANQITRWPDDFCRSVEEELNDYQQETAS